MRHDHWIYQYRSRNIKREFFNKNSGSESLLSILSENLSRKMGDIEHRKFFKILFPEKEEKNGVVAEGGIYVQERFLVLCVSSFT